MKANGDGVLEICFNKVIDSRTISCTLSMASSAFSAEAFVYLQSAPPWYLVQCLRLLSYSDYACSSLCQRHIYERWIQVVHQSSRSRLSSLDWQGNNACSDFQRSLTSNHTSATWLEQNRTTIQVPGQDTRSPET